DTLFVHSVYFWLKDDLTQAEVDDFKAGLYSLERIESIKHAFTGRPADTDRPVIDKSYSYGLVTIFEDSAHHERYQVDPIHDRFRTECAKYWSKVLIYDFQA